MMIKKLTTLLINSSKKHGFIRLNFSSRKNLRGFTLIELLIVIAIIGILASVVMSALNSARLKARNVARISELTQIRKALEMYYDDFGVYPSSNNPNSDCSWGTPPGDDPNNLIPGLVPDYLPEISTDPTHRYVADPLLNQSCKSYFSNGREYKFSLLNLRDPSPGALVFDYSVYPNFIDPRKDGGDVCVVETDGKDNGAGNISWIISTEGTCATQWWN